MYKTTFVFEATVVEHPIGDILKSLGALLETEHNMEITTEIRGLPDIPTDEQAKTIAEKMAEKYMGAGNSVYEITSVKFVGVKDTAKMSEEEIKEHLEGKVNEEQTGGPEEDQ